MPSISNSISCALRSSVPLSTTRPPTTRERQQQAFTKFQSITDKRLQALAPSFPTITAMLARPLGTRGNREIAVDDKENSFRPQAHYGRRRSAMHDFAHLNGTCVGSCDRHDGGIGGSSVAKVPPLNLGPLQSSSAVQRGNWLSSVES